MVAQKIQQEKSFLKNSPAPTLSSKYCVTIHDITNKTVLLLCIATMRMLYCLTLIRRVQYFCQENVFESQVSVLIHTLSVILSRSLAYMYTHRSSININYGLGAKECLINVTLTMLLHFGVQFSKTEV